MDNKSKIMNYARRRGAIRPKDVESIGIPRLALYRLVRQGELIRTARGLYSPAAFDPTEHHTSVEVTVAIPKAIICLLSALQFHDLTTQMPNRVWVAIDRKARKPRTSLPVTIVRFSGESLIDGIETHTVEGVDLRVTTPAKTVADCFKYRNKIGIDVAIEALSDCIKRRKATRDEIWRYAKLCRVANVIRPYMEAMS
jgi:predicted transcriptional regulator of viral defense system